MTLVLNNVVVVVVSVQVKRKIAMRKTAIATAGAILLEKKGI